MSASLAMTQLLVLALQSVDDADAAAVFSDALEELAVDERQGLEENVAAMLGVAVDGRAVASVLLFAGWPDADAVTARWPVLEACRRGPLSLLERVQLVGRRRGVDVVAMVPEEDGALRVVAESAGTEHTPGVISQLYDELRNALPRGVGLRLDYRILDADE